MRLWIDIPLFICLAAGVTCLLLDHVAAGAAFAFASSLLVSVENAILKRDLRFAQVEARAGAQLAAEVIALGQARAEVERLAGR